MPEGRDSVVSIGTESDPADPLVLVGEITAPFGIQGQVKIHPLIDDPNVLAKLPGVTLRYPDGKEARARITRTRPHGGGQTTLVTFDGVTDRNHSETLRDVLILIRQSELPRLEEGSYYASQLRGLRVITDTGRDFGPIEAVHFYPANDVYETEVAMIPAVESVVLSVDLEAGTMLVHDLPGLRKDE